MTPSTLAISTVGHVRVWAGVGGACDDAWVTSEAAEAQRLRDLVRMRRVRDRIDREYAQPLDVEALARGAHMSAGHLSREFRRAYGESPYSYLMTRRVERAMALLRRGDLSVTEVCFEVGCSSLGTFSSRFSELVGMSPSNYRRHAARALELVDDRGRVRAEIKVLPAQPALKMPDGTVGYPETVQLRLIDSKGGPNVKLVATEDGSGLVLGGESAYVQILARGGTPFLKVVNKDGRQRTINADPGGSDRR